MSPVTSSASHCSGDSVLIEFVATFVLLNACAWASPARGVEANTASSTPISWGFMGTDVASAMATATD